MTRPQWLRPIVAAAHGIKAEQPARSVPPRDGSARASAVLVLFGETDGEPDVLLTERAHSLRRHPGQAAFPGGVVDPTDDGPVAAALRVGREETGLDPAGVDVVTTLPTIWMPYTNYAVTPVVAWWREPCEVRVVDEAEVAAVRRVPLAELLDPANRMLVRHPSGAVGPAFQVGDLLVWGFTAGVLSRMFEAAGIDEPWDRSDIRDLPEPVRYDERSWSREGRGAM